MSFPDRSVGGRWGIILTALVASLALVVQRAVSSTPAPSTPLAARNAPPPGHTGGFGEPSCHKCHWEGDLNEPAGTLAIEGLPARYQPAVRYRITVTLRHPELATAGFELSARYERGPDVGKQAGSFTPTDERSAVTKVDSTGVSYLHHVRAGTIPVEPRTGRWVVVWTAPLAGSGPVVFHLAANATNDNDSELGDYVYTKSVSVGMGEK